MNNVLSFPKHFSSTSSSKNVICLVSSNSFAVLLHTLFHHVLQTVFPSGTAVNHGFLGRVDVFLFGPVSEVTQCPVGEAVESLESSALLEALIRVQDWLFMHVILTLA